MLITITVFTYNEQIALVIIVIVIFKFKIRPINYFCIKCDEKKESGKYYLFK